VSPIASGSTRRPAPSSWYARPAARSSRCAEVSSEVSAFHQSLPGYAPTPLVEMPALAQELGVARVFVKDESSRLGLPAFKVLGASWAACRVVTARACAPTAGVDMEYLRALIATMSSMKLVTATDGNHGRALARMASLLDLPSEVFVPAVMRPDVAAAITAEGATVTWVDGSYDDAVAAAARAAAYSATNAARAALTRAWAAEFSPRGVRVNTIAPGPVYTGGTTAERIEALGATTLLARAAQPEEIAEVVAFLASPKAGYVTGAVVAADGGRTAV
jgi:NAD(P)-dependent dehydrogenase (short-subunit alcohol dehydrogenase family)